MDDILCILLPLVDITTLMSFRQVCRQIDKLLDFNYWIERFRREEMLIFATKLPRTAASWIREYLIVKDVYYEAKFMLTFNRYIILDNFIAFTVSWDVDVNYDAYPSQEMLTELLPKNYIPSPYLYRISIEDNYKTVFRGWQINDDIKFDHKLFLLRLLYYFPNVYLVGKNNKTLRSKHIDYTKHIVRM